METIVSCVEKYIRQSATFLACCTGKPFLRVQGLEGYPLAMLVRLVARKRQGRVWVVCPTEDNAMMTLRDLGARITGRRIDSMMNDEIPCIYLPSSGKMLYEDEGQGSGTYEQVDRLAKIANCKNAIIVTHLRPFVSPVVTKEEIDKATLDCVAGGDFKPQEMALRLTECGYAKSPSTTNPGEFTIRGEVMDIFPFEAKEPYRLYADWDKIGKICTYDALTQQTLKSVKSLEITLFGGETDRYGQIDAYFHSDDYFFFVGDQRLSTSYKSLVSEARALYRGIYRDQRDAIVPDKLLFDFENFEQECSSSMTILDLKGQEKTPYSFDIDGPRSYFGSFILLKQDLSALLKDHWTITIFSGNATQTERLKQMLSSYPQLQYEAQELSGGFGIPEKKVIALCEHEIFGRRRQVVKTLQHVQSTPLDSFVDLNEGDYVVHVNYGIGKFLKIDRVKSFDKERDYIKIEYANEEMLYVPIEQANLVQRYIGSAGNAPKLDKLGGTGWAHKKAKARKSAEELASQLIDLYARRKNSVGYAFQKDNDMQLQFEALFPFDETPDQLSCIDDIKADMESPHVMDRLVCGDVGYGKTEIAFRAAFKAVLSGKQVAFLAPTTILAEQHYRNFLERSKEFPVNCALLSRIIPPSEQKKTRLAVTEGKVDVLFGTHRILQKDILFKNLGLLVIDEEQRFGVKDKERIKELKSNIDCLTLSATPIPRTLYMSLLQIRDMSLLTTPPIERLPIETTIGEYNEETVIKAIRREVDRGGQVFYLHNRIESLETVVGFLTRALPDVVIEAAHGQMDSDDLEDTMRRFIHQGIQVLVSTTIIENGIDIPNVNTIIIDRADLYGVSQLYQLRGRVGRSDIQAFAYLFYPHDVVLSELAVKRLKVISEHTKLGSGFKVAMKDMEIRGTGNLLGREQSGQVSSVGLDMYIRILDEAIHDLQKNGEDESRREVFLELDYSGFIPDSYITAPSVKFDVYRRISGIMTEEQLQALSGELADKYGPIPEEVNNLLYIAEIKILCRKLEIVHLTEKKGVVFLEFARVAAVNPMKVIAMLKQSGGSVKYDQARPNFLSMKTSAVSLKDKALFIMEKLQRLL